MKIYSDKDSSRVAESKGLRIFLLVVGISLVLMSFPRITTIVGFVMFAVGVFLTYAIGHELYHWKE